MFRGIRLNRTWLEVSDLEPSTILNMHSSAIDGDFIPDPTGKGNHSGAYADKPRFDEALARSEKHIQLFLEEIKSVEGTISYPYLFLWNSPEGILLHSSCPPSMTEIPRQAGLVPGLLMDKHVLGLNAISLAMETGRTVVVRGDEHTVNLFVLWNCVCCPVRAGEAGEIVGYLDISFDFMYDPGFVVPLLSHLAIRIGEAIDALGT
ncbi:hypothetical protein [Paenibacillus sp. MMS18-CY102]|uniref:hypothetical protein n=1 Tax=Paenibacillus sp. MMS18-CY102 TaxID=2682849 RepID=UPI00136647A1|nr:hypothetical protein [Paenibacillus sp. MMS18-CY102]MWC27775.1 hypothetical protein [Paenibacillus sp. MMS18-CY102]